jgi:lactoylglutathione lyase
MAARFTHLGHCVRDLEAARAFYEQALGFVYDGELNASTDDAAKRMRLAPPLDVTAAYLRLDGFLLELLHYASPRALPARDKPLNEPGLTHMSLTVDDLAATEALVRRHGGSVLEDTRGPEKVWIADPDGQRIELLTPKAGYHRRARPAR